MNIHAMYIFSVVTSYHRFCGFNWFIDPYLLGIFHWRHRNSWMIPLCRWNNNESYEWNSLPSTNKDKLNQHWYHYTIGVIFCMPYSQHLQHDASCRLLDSTLSSVSCVIWIWNNEMWIWYDFQYTVGCHYNAVLYNTTLHITLQWQRQNTNQGLRSQKTPHISPWRTSYGVSIVMILVKIDGVITALRCNAQCAAHIDTEWTVSFNWFIIIGVDDGLPSIHCKIIIQTCIVQPLIKTSYSNVQCYLPTWNKQKQVHFVHGEI